MSTLNNRKKFGPQRSGMTHAQWRQAQRVRSGARWFFNRSLAKPGINCSRSNPSTYCVGRNAAKRKARAAAESLRSAWR